MIIKVIFNDNHTMLFGDSYKPWHTQLGEYLHTFKNHITGIKEVYQSNEKWITWGGLKWCPEENFQEELNREGCQTNDPGNPNPRKYKNMTFSKATLKTLKQINCG